VHKLHGLTGRRFWEEEKKSSNLMPKGDRMQKKPEDLSANQKRQYKQASIRTAITLARQHRWRQALTINQQINASYHVEAGDYNRLGKCHLELGQLTEAIDAYEFALRIDPANAIALRNSTALKARIKSLPAKSIQKPRSAEALEQVDKKEECLEPKFELNTRVRIIVTGAIGIVTEILPQAQYRIFIREHEEPIVSESDIEELVSGTGYVTPQEFLRDLLIFKMRRPLSDTLYSYSMSRTHLEIYQFKPAIKFLNNPYGKILIADEVGLGKTIEACIIYLELKARMRGDLPRVLVVCPSGLRDKWQSELSLRFSEEFELMDSQRLQSFFGQFRDSGGSQRLRGICSIETLRRPELTAQITELGVDFDLVIIDEAHHMRNPDAQSFDLGRTLSDHADHLIMLTATPVHLHSDDLFYLLNILEPGEFENREVFQYQLEPNKLLNKAIEELSKEMPNLEDACSYLDMCPPHMKENPYWTETRGLIETMGDLDQVVRRKKIATAMRNLSELNNFSLLFTRTRRKEVGPGVLRTAMVIEILLSEKEQEIYTEALRFARARAQYSNGYVFMLGLIQIERQLASSIGAFREIIEDFGKNLTAESGVEDSPSDLDRSNTLPIEEVNAIGTKLLGLYEELGDVDTKYDTLDKDNRLFVL
jgi:SNF2 family DNA or RNA helicase